MPQGPFQLSVAVHSTLPSIPGLLPGPGSEARGGLLLQVKELIPYLQSTTLPSGSALRTVRSREHSQVNLWGDKVAAGGGGMYSKIHGMTCP